MGVGGPEIGQEDKRTSFLRSLSGIEKGVGYLRSRVRTLGARRERQRPKAHILEISQVQSEVR